MSYETIIGLEIHTQLATTTKAWCACEIKTNAFENTKVCEICSGQPGTLPVLNEKVLDFAIKTGLATNCKINKVSFFDRKNYFYPDLPKGYQITQFHLPVAQDGFIMINDDSGAEKKIGIQRIQIEEDTGKSTHQGDGSLINLNRAGTPLLEIVGHPDIRTPKEASSYFKKIHSILVYLGVSHGNLQDGNLRCDVNVSLRKKGETKFGTRTEVKNINSFKNVEKAIEYEVERHRGILESGGKIIQQTMLFDMNENKTIPLRTKSDADDYRYFPEPDLVPAIITENQIVKVKESLPELPDQKVKRFIEQYGLPEYDSSVLASTKELANYFEEAVKHYSGEAKQVSNWIMVELLRLLNESGTEIQKSRVSAIELSHLLNHIAKGSISGRMAKDVFVVMYDKSITADEAIKQSGSVQLNDTKAIEEAALKVLKENPTELANYKAGKVKLFGFFVGQLMKETKGQANPQLANDVLKKVLDAGE